MGAAACAGAASARSEAQAFEPTVFELRSYQTQPGRRDDLIAMFEASFLDAYEAGGARIVATFTDVDDPNRWVWIRAFRDAASRGGALNAFYTSPAWRAKAAAANATIADTSNVLLLQPWTGSAMSSGPPEASTALIVATVYVLTAASEEAFASFFAREIVPVLRDLGALPFATFATDRSPNSFLRQQVRGDTVFVTLTRFEDVSGYGAFVSAQSASTAWREHVGQRLARRVSATETLRLQPTARSRLR
jgi:quinol monooxygenase YgiN